MSEPNAESKTGPTVVQAGLLAREDANPGDVVALLASRCEDCKLVAFPKRSTCEACGKATSRVELSTRATLIAHTEVIHPPPDALVEVPYGIGLVRFPEGISILGLLDDALRQSAEVGTPVETFAHEAFEGGLTYGYRRA